MFDDVCYECGAYGDDYSYNEETGELERNCDQCPYNGSTEDSWDD